MRDRWRWKWATVQRDPREGQEQLRIYLDKVVAREGQTFVPFGFMTNGQDTTKAVLRGIKNLFRNRIG